MNHIDFIFVKKIIDSFFEILSSVKDYNEVSKKLDSLGINVNLLMYHNFEFILDPHNFEVLYKKYLSKFESKPPIVEFRYGNDIYNGNTIYLRVNLHDDYYHIYLHNLFAFYEGQRCVLQWFKTDTFHDNHMSEVLQLVKQMKENGGYD